MRNKEYKMALIMLCVVFFTVTGIMLFINLTCGIICFMLSLFAVFVFVVFTKRRYKQIEKLNDYLSLVCSGNYSLDIEDNTEGELSILKNNLFKVVVMLQSSNEALKKDKVYLADSLADISHQLKTPLTSMMVMTDLIKQERNAEKQKDFVEIIESQLEKMKWLIATLLKLSKLDAGTAELNRDSIGIDALVDDSLKPFILSLELKNITVRKNVDDFSFIGDKNWSIEAIENIIKNCIEHTESGGHIKIETKITSIYNELIISDNGSGIDKEDLPHIFERFYHGKNASSDSVGIGLALSKEIMLKQNADIDVFSNEDGTSFCIKFYKSIV